MKAVILAAGEGKRLRPLTISEPKVMLPVANRPILEYVIEALTQVNIREIIIVVGYRKESIMSYFGDGDDFNVAISYVTQKKQLGTAHALFQAKDHIESGDEFIVLPGDNIISHEGLRQLLAQPAPSALITEHDLPSKYGVVTTMKGRLTSIIEKPEEMISNLISTGIFHFYPTVFDYIGSCGRRGGNDLTSVIAEMIHQGESITVAKTKQWLDVIFPWDMLNVNEIAL